MHKHTHRRESAAQTEGRLIRWASAYDGLVNIMTFGHARRLRSLTVKNALLQPGEEFLDVGCGTGAVTIPAKLQIGKHGRAAGIDPSPEMVSVARRKASRDRLDIDFRMGVIESIPFGDDSFDVVISSLMMHHLPGHVRLKGLAEIYRVLKPGGRLLIADITRPGTSFFKKFLSPLALHQAMQHGGREKFGIEDLAILLEDAGFVNIEQLEGRFLSIGFLRATKQST